MTKHLTSEEIAAVIAGLELGDDVRRHLESCLTCRAEAAGLGELIEARRAEIVAEEPDWQASAERIMARLPADGPQTVTRRPRWMRPVLALAATVVIAIGVGVLWPGGPAEPPANDLAVEDILAEMDELLSDDRIPGFEAIDPGADDLTAYIDNGAS
jgi:hypothetical protein